MMISIFWIRWWQAACVSPEHYYVSVKLYRYDPEHIHHGYLIMNDVLSIMYSVLSLSQYRNGYTCCDIRQQRVYHWCMAQLTYVQHVSVRITASHLCSNARNR